MNCPVCNVPLTMMDRQGVEIDYCQRCRGVWLDRGELDKIIERSASYQSSQHSGGSHYEDRSQYENREHHYKQHDDHRHDYKQHDNYYGHKKKKKESFLSDLFDFD